MSTAVGEDSIRVIVSKDHMAAEMLIPGDFARTMLTEQVCLGALQQSGVEIKENVIETVKQMLANVPPAGEEYRQVLVAGVLPQHGKNGSIEWRVSEPGETEKTEGEDAGDDEQAVSHYDRSAYIVVKAGDIIGVVIEPTTGVDGRDVLGATVAAMDGKPVALKLDDSVMRNASGELVAQANGILHRDLPSITVQQVLEVTGYVDFSTGNIDFTGDVNIREGIRDCFVVNATGNVEVKGLIEAATIECGGDLIAHGGMAGRERGYVNIGRNLTAKYLDNIQGEIEGDLEIQREAINCDLIVHGAIISPRGTIIGGKVGVTGAVEVTALGSGAGVATELVLGSVPKLEPFATQLESLAEQYAAKRDEVEAQQKLMKKNTRMMSAADKERQTEMMFEHQNSTSRLAKATAAGEALAAKIKQERTVDLTVQRKLFSGAVITIGIQSFKIYNDVSGPIKIYLAENGDVVYRKGDSDPSLLAKIAEVKASAK